MLRGVRKVALWCGKELITCGIYSCAPNVYVLGSHAFRMGVEWRENKLANSPPISRVFGEGRQVAG